MNETIFKMKKSTIICITFLFIGNRSVFSQKYNIQPKQGIELQFGANSPVVSIKYQRFLWINSQQHFTASVGGGLFYGVNFNQDLTYSIGDGRNFLEVGVLGLYTSTRFEYRTNYRYYVLPMIGYKYISPKWFSTRLNFSPYFEKGQFYPYGGISMSFHFNGKKYSEPSQNINTVRYYKD
jgi:hypothetical protein